MSFTPKFVDLVKDFTTVQGTGPVSLDQPVTGFTSFASACAPGDQFYYCIQGIDRPAEREVGRGTMLAGGTISRDPIGGAATNFTKGKKSIALVTTAEWLTQVDAAIKAPPAAAGDKLFSEMAGAGVPATQRQLMSAGYAAAGVGTARYVQDAAVNSAYVAAHPYSSFLAADGRGFKLDPEQELNAAMFGVVVNDSSAPVQAANLARLTAALEIPAKAGSDYSVPVRLPLGDIYIGGTLEPNKVFTLKGGGSSLYGGGQQGHMRSRLISPTNVTTIRLKAASIGLSAGGQAGQIHTGGSVIEGVWIAQASQGNDLNAHGIHARSTPIIRDCIFDNIAGHGIALIGYTGATDWKYGNCNLWRINNCEVYACGGNALHVEGSDAGAGICVGFDTRYPLVRGCGIRDAAQFYNEYHGVHLDGCGDTGVHHNGAIWQLHADVDTGTVPGTNGEIWHKLFTQASPSGSFPAWSNATTYRAQLPFLISNGSTINGYQEFRALKAHGGSKVTGAFRTTDLSPWFSFSQAQGITNQRGFARVRSSGIGAAWPGWANLGSGETVSIGETDPGNGEYGRAQILNYTSDAFGGRGDFEKFAIRWDGNGRVIWQSNNRTVAFIEGAKTTSQYGRATAQPDTLALAGYALAPYGGDGSDDTGYVIDGRKHHSSRNGPPTGGNHAAGEYVWNLNPGAYPNTLGWQCTAEGTPGTWVACATGGFTGTYGGTAKFTSVKVGYNGTGAAVDGGEFVITNSSGFEYRTAFNASSGAVYVDNNKPGVGWGDVNIRAGNISLYTSDGGSGVSPIVTAWAQGWLFHKSFGYNNGWGVGGAVTQATSKSTGVTLNKNCGQVTMNGAALAAGSSANFTLTNSQIAATDVVMVNIGSGASANSYLISVTAVAAGSCRIHLRNVSGGSLAEALVLNFAVIKAANS